MNLFEGTLCKECLTGRLRTQDVAQEFEREGMVVKIEGIPAYACDHCGEMYFPPGISNHIKNAADEMFALALTKHRGKTGLSVVKTRSAAGKMKSRSVATAKSYARQR